MKDFIKSRGNEGQMVGRVTLEGLSAQVASLQERVVELEKRPRAGRPPTRLHEVKEWLVSVLKEEPRRPRWIMREGVLVKGFSESLIRKAALRIGVVKEREHWRLPRD